MIEKKECPWCGNVMKLKQGEEDPARKYSDCLKCGVTWRSFAGKDKVEVVMFFD